MAKSKDVVKQNRKATRRKFSADEKIRIVLERALENGENYGLLERKREIPVIFIFLWVLAFFLISDFMLL